MHFVGKDFQDDYSTVLKEYVNNFDLNTSVLSMMLNMTFSIFYLSTIGILASTAEGFPSFTRIWFSSTGSFIN
jgi:hypothetical protein